VSVGEPLPLLGVGEPLALLGVDDPPVPVKTVVVGDPLSPLLLENSVEAVPVALALETNVVCVAPVVPLIERETLIT
jgi:hypothetical protein